MDSPSEVYGKVAIKKLTIEWFQQKLVNMQQLSRRLLIQGVWAVSETQNEDIGWRMYTPTVTQGVER